MEDEDSGSTRIKGCVGSRGKRLDNKAKALIHMTLSDQTLKDVKQCRSAKSIWDTLKNIYTIYDPFHGFELFYEFVNIKKTPEESVSQYLARRSDAYDKVNDTGYILRQVGLVIKGLSKEYEAVARTMRARNGGDDPGDPVLDKLKAKLLTEEKRLQTDTSEISAALKVKSHKSKGNERRKTKVSSDDDQSDEDWNKKQ
jgi:hypothetical protein